MSSQRTAQLTHRRVLVTLGVAAACALSEVNVVLADKGPPMRPARDELRTIVETNTFMLGRPSQPRFVADGSAILFLRSGPRDRSSALYELDIASGKERLLVSPAQLLGGEAETLSTEEKAARERKRISTGGFTGYEVSADGTRIRVELSGKIWIIERKTGAFWSLPIPDGVVLDPKLSPDGERVAFVRDHDLYVSPVGSKASPGGEITRITTGGSADVSHGLAEFVAQEEMGRFSGYWWSPDGTKLAYQRTDTRALERFTIADASRPERGAHTFPYPRPGRANADVQLFVTGIDGTGTVEIGWDRAALPYLARVIWQRGAPLTLYVQSRDQRTAMLLAASPAGRTSVLLIEKDPAWINLTLGTPRWLSDGLSFLFATEREGAWTLERHWPAGRPASAGSGRPHGGPSKVVVLGASSGLSQLLHVDEARGVVWFTGGPSPVENHVFRAPLDGGSPPVQVSPDGGEHDAIFAQGGSMFALARTTAKQPQRYTLHRAEDVPASVDRAAAIPSVAVEPAWTPNLELVPPERAGGFHAVLIRPRGFVPGKKYPVVLNVYGGPGFQIVHTALTTYFIPQWVADHGFIVVSIDGRGTPRRGRAYERALAGKFGSVPLEDQVAGLEALGRSHPELDLQRVGVYGWSFGGYMAALAVLKRPDVFKAAVAGAPVTAWEYYDTHYTERYLGLPEEAPAAYADASLLTHAAKLERPLLLVHGIADDNVYFAHTLQLADVLFRSRRPFELLPLVNLTHQVADPSVREALYERIVHFLGAALW